MESLTEEKRRKKPPNRRRLIVLITVFLLLAGFFLLNRRQRLNDALNEAFLKGDEEEAHHLLDSGADPNIRILARRPDSTPVNPLEMLRSLLDPHHTEPASNFRTALMSVSQSGNTILVHDLLIHGADPNIRLENGTTALLLASRPLHIEIVSDLLKHHADLRAVDKNGKTAVICAAESGAEDVVQLLLEHGANILDTDKQGRTPLFAAAQNGRAGCVKRLIEGGANSIELGRTGYPPLLWAAANGSEDLLQRFWKEETQAEREKWGPAALNLAIEAGSVPSARFLLDQNVSVQPHAAWTLTFRPNTPPGSSPVPAGPQRVTGFMPGNQPSNGFVVTGGIFDPKQKTYPLLTAAHTGSPEIVQMLLEKGAAVNTADASGMTPLLAAMNPVGAINFTSRNPFGVSMNNIHTSEDSLLKVCRLLLDRGADIHVRNRMGQTALMLGCNQSPDLVRMLLDHGVEVNAQDRMGQTVLLMVSNPKTRRLLVEHGANVNQRDRTGRTPLMHAVLYDMTPETAKLLIEHGADVNAADSKGQTALTLAQQMRRKETVEMLKKAGAKEITISADGL